MTKRKNTLLTAVKAILTATVVAVFGLFALPTLAAEKHPTGVFFGDGVAVVKFDCPAGLTCPDTEDTVDGISGSVLVAQSDGFNYIGNELDAFFMNTSHALHALKWMSEYYHLIEFHALSVADLQRAKKQWLEFYRECVENVSQALGFLNAHQRKHNLPQSREHPFVSCPDKEPSR